VIAAVLVATIAQQSPELVFRSEVRMVEVYAAVFHGGEYVDGLSADRFRILDNRVPVQIRSFEPAGSVLTCAILLDTTGSMEEDLPGVKNSINRLIDDLRPADRVGVFGFSSSLTVLRDFDQDKKEAKNAVLRVRAGGTTALFDAISQTAQALAAQRGRKALIVFTDGKDNASVLNLTSAGRRAKRSGVPIYTVALGEALKARELRDQLEDLAWATGGNSYEARGRKHLDRMFADISLDMSHTYMLAYQTPSDAGRNWRVIEVTIPGGAKCKIRAKEGYFLD